MIASGDAGGGSFGADVQGHTHLFKRRQTVKPPTLGKTEQTLHLNTLASACICHMPIQLLGFEICSVSLLRMRLIATGVSTWSRYCSEYMT